MNATERHSVQAFKRFFYAALPTEERRRIERLNHLNKTLAHTQKDLESLQEEA